MVQQFGRYELKAKLGQGGMATVYRAHDPRFKRDVAVKVLPPAYLDNTMFRLRFEREAQVIASLEYPGIVPVYDFGEQEGQLYLVMRFMPGGSLADRISARPPRLDEITRIFNHLAPALDHVHDRGIIHRDLKPGNILFDQYDSAWISDFGIARLNEGSATLTGDAVIGTPAYMSPEQAQGLHELDGRSDIYAMGAILFEMLTGKQPYEATTPMAVILKHITEPIPRLLSIKADLPAELEDIITRSMEKDREARYPSMAAMAADLNTVNEKQLSAPAASAAHLQASPMPSTVHPDQVEATVLDEGPQGSAQPYDHPLSAPARETASPSQPAPGSPPPAIISPGKAQPIQAAPTSKPVRKARKSLSPVWIMAVLILAGFACLAAATGGWWLYTSLRNAAPTDLANLDITNTPVVMTTEEIVVQNPDPGQKGVFFDDFSNPDSGWQTYEGENGRMDYQFDSFQILVDVPNWLMISRPFYSAANVQIKTEAYKSSGPDDNIFGVVCRYMDEDNFYFLVISSDGYYGVAKLINGETTIIGTNGMTYSSSINQGRTSNTIQAVCSDNNLSISANGILLTSVKDEDLKFGEVGLIVGSYTQHGVTILFDNFNAIELAKP